MAELNYKAAVDAAIQRSLSGAAKKEVRPDSTEEIEEIKCLNYRTQGAKSGEDMRSMGFDPSIHLQTPLDLDEQQQALVNEFRNKLRLENEIYKQEQDIRTHCTSSILHHFLIARQYNVDKAFAMISSALEWRNKRRP